MWHSICSRSSVPGVRRVAQTAPAKLAGKGKGNLIAMLTTDVELLEIFFAHTISPVAIAVTSTIIYTIVAATLSPWMALALIAAHLVIGILVPRFFATAYVTLALPSVALPENSTM